MSSLNHIALPLTHSPVVRITFNHGPPMSSPLSKLWTVPLFLLKKVLNQFSSPPYMEPTQLSPGKYCIPGPCYSLSGASATSLLSSWEAILPPLCVTRPPTATEARTCGFQHLSPPLSSTLQITPLSEHSRDRPHGRSVMAPSPKWWLWKEGARFDSRSYLPHICDGPLCKQLSDI